MWCSNYTTYATYYRLVKAVEDDPNLPKKKAARALAKFMSLHPHNIEQKTEVMVEHFRQKVRGHLGGRGQGDGRHVVAPPRRALHAGVRALHRGEQDTPTCARWSPSAARSKTRTPVSNTPSRG